MFISTKKSLRKDLPEEIENVVKTKLEVSLKNASDHHVHFLFIVNSIAIVLKTLTFVDNNGDLSLETSCGYNVLQVLPDKFIRKNDIKPVFSSLTLPHNIPGEYQRELEDLFTDQHLSLINSHLFGSYAQQRNLERHPLEKFL
ncbi:hypothetical protein HPULCUR_004172 [Helicostylum pulchrum]|uniref:Uncharacterized protein n=1 Tax=Helicostylum pulchrum TaxID=562976 RepID=A0ABP9XVF7_9FUNG